MASGSSAGGLGKLSGQGAPPVKLDLAYSTGRDAASSLPPSPMASLLGFLAEHFAWADNPIVILRQTLFMKL